jgi:hypothetical protein
MLDGLVVIELGGKSNPKWAAKMCTFGEAAVVKEKKSDKSTDHGITLESSQEQRLS